MVLLDSIEWDHRGRYSVGNRLRPSRKGKNDPKSHSEIIRDPTPTTGTRGKAGFILVSKNGASLVKGIRMLLPSALGARLYVVQCFGVKSISPN